MHTDEPVLCSRSVSLALRVHCEGVDGAAARHQPVVHDLKIGEDAQMTLDSTDLLLKQLVPEQSLEFTLP